jgi:hypothetical protein
MSQSNDRWWGPITITILIGLLLMAGYALVRGITLNGAELIIGGLMVKLGTLLDFRYGSSKGSKEKTDLLNQKNDAN